MPAVSGPVTALPAVAATVRSTGRFSRTRAASSPATAPSAALTARDESLCTASVVALTSCPLRNRKSNAERTAVRLLPSEKRCALASGESSSPAVRKTTASVAVLQSSFSSTPPKIRAPHHRAHHPHVLQSSFSSTPPKRPLMRSFRNPGACAEASPRKRIKTASCMRRISRPVRTVRMPLICPPGFSTGPSTFRSGRQYHRAVFLRPAFLLQPETFPSLRRGAGLCLQAL